jgi:hypothetical protein
MSNGWDTTGLNQLKPSPIAEVISREHLRHRLSAHEILD